MLCTNHMQYSVLQINSQPHIKKYNTLWKIGGGKMLKLAAFVQVVTADDMIDGKYLLVQKGKKNYFLITVK